VPISAGARDFSSPKPTRWALEPNQSPIQWVLVTISQGITRPGREDGQSPLSSAEVEE
jgi:hypothetical protein